MNTAELKIKIFSQIDSLDSNKMEEFYGVLLNFINSKKEANEWLELTDQQREGVDAAIEELDSGKGISHQEVIKKLREKPAGDGETEMEDLPSRGFLKINI
jgi:hypothetical protein